MTRKLELIREAKIHQLLPGEKKKSRLEASGVALVDDDTAAVVFDNCNLVARIELSLERSNPNRLGCVPSLAAGFEDIAIDHAGQRVFCVIESMEDADGKYRSLVSEYDQEMRFQRCARLSTAFTSPNKGFEGLAHLRRGGKEYLFTICEGNLCTDAKSGGGRIQAFTRTPEYGWEWTHEMALPDSAEFKDYACMDYREPRLAVVSQEAKRVWIGRVDEQARSFVEGSGEVFRFPKKSYGNVEGIAWLSDDLLVAVSDKKKDKQSDKYARKDQSIHIFRIPG